MKHHRFHVVFYRLARLLLGWVFALRYRIRAERVRPQHKPFLVLSNHATNGDGELVGLSFSDHIYFVASEHLFRQGLVSWLLKTFLAPILRMKAKTEFSAAKNILKALRGGCNVCMFPEGSNTWSGETGQISDATAKLVKASGAALITYRLEGGFLTRPRWGCSIRRGGMRGHAVREYSPGQLAGMSTEEVATAIRRDLAYNVYTDAFASARRYPGRRLAENLEAALFICPECGGISTLKSAGDRFFCGCGLSLRYDEHGHFISLGSRPAPFETVLDWDRWQRQEVQARAAAHQALPADAAITSDPDEQVLCYRPREAAQPLINGRLTLYRDRLEVAGGGERRALALAEITDMAIIKQGWLLITARGDRYYELRSAHPRSALKYLLLASSLSPMKTLI